jgi:drug/metabolite transporter (DMT)-like permease
VARASRRAQDRASIPPDLAMPRLLGPALILLFVLSQALRDVYLAHVFRSVDVFATILAAFAPMALGFGLWAAWRDRAGLARLRAHAGVVLAMNVTTAAAWTSYFFGLKAIQPSVVNALHSGMGPLTVVGLALAGWRLAGADRWSRLEGALYAGLAASMAFLWFVVLDGRSGRADFSLGEALVGLCALLASGVSITLSHLLAKRLNERGVGANAVTGARYLLIVAAAAAALLLRDAPTGLSGPADWAALAALATPLIALPLYALQIGISLTAPLTAQVLRALGPVVVFAFELVDPRVGWSGAALAGVLAYSVFALAAGLARGSGKQRP